MRRAVGGANVVVRWYRRINDDGQYHGEGQTCLGDHNRGEGMRAADSSGSSRRDSAFRDHGRTYPICQATGRRRDRPNDQNVSCT